LIGPLALTQGHEQIVYGSDPASGLSCIIAIHSTALGPALGGTRFYPYLTEEEALTDVLRLSRAMSYKASSAGLDLGGGKAVIIGPPQSLKTEPLLRAYGRVVESLGGRYITACDVGTRPADMSIVARETRWVTGAEVADGGSGDSGAMTAYGTFVGIRACLERVFGSDDVGGRHIAVQGLGKVGYPLAEMLVEAGAWLSVADVNGEVAEEVGERYQAEVVPVDKIHSVEADVFSPNALGAVINPTTVPDLRCRIVAGAANNQLAGPDDAGALASRGILYAPDYVINAGGLVQVSEELRPGGYDAARVRAKVDGIAGRLHRIFDLAHREGVTTTAAADRLAEERMLQVGRLRSFWLPAG
jgi:valine dehydrogenase (NAD+)